MLKSLLSKSIEEIKSNFDLYLDFYIPKIPLREEDELNYVFPFNPPESKQMKVKQISKIFNVTKKKRKEKGDNIRKKIKTFFHKSLRQIINEKLEKAGAKYFFESFPQIFITDITIRTNFEVMELTYEQLFAFTYNQEINDDKSDKRKDYINKRKATAIKKYRRNVEVLEYLGSNEKISKESGWEVIKNMKYKDLFQAYINSQEFQESVEELSKKETINYISSYNYFASNYISFFLSYHSKNKEIEQKETLLYFPSEKSEFHRKITPNPNNDFENKNDDLDSIISLSSICPSSIYEMVEYNSYLPDPLNFPRNNDYELINGKSLITGKNILFEREDYSLL